MFIRRKTKKIFFASLILFGFLVLFVAIVLFSYHRIYAGKIYNHVYFENVNLSGLTTIQAEFLLKNKLKSVLNRQVQLAAEGKSISIKLADTGLSYDYPKIAAESYGLGRESNFAQKLKNITISLFKNTNVTTSPDLDQTKYDGFVNLISTQLNVSPQDATISVRDGEIVLSDSHDGQVVKTETLAKAIINLAGTQNNRHDLAVEINPAKTVSSNLAKANQQATELLAKSYVFASRVKKYTPTKAQVGAWIELASVDGQTVTQLSQSKIKLYLDTIAKDFTVVSIDQKVNANTDDIIDPGRAGVALNEDKAAADVISQINNSSVLVSLATTTTPPKIVKVTPSEGLVLGRFESKYIDIDLTTQQLCRVDGQSLVDCNSVSTGKASLPTPTGTFSIQSKNQRAWSVKYGLFMPWWQQISGSYGIHELPEWPSGYKEGEAHLGHPVSHGCIRLGVGPAETTYNWTETGTPVYIHK